MSEFMAQFKHCKKFKEMLVAEKGFENQWLKNKIKLHTTRINYSMIKSISLEAHLAHPSQDPSPSIPFFEEA